MGDTRGPARHWDAETVAEVRQRIIDRPLEAEGVGALVWGGDNTNSLIFGTCKCDDCHGDTLAMEVGSRAARYGILCNTQRQHSLEDMGRWAANGIQMAYEERERDDARAIYLALLEPQS